LAGVQVVELATHLVTLVVLDLGVGYPGKRIRGTVLLNMDEDTLAAEATTVAIVEGAADLFAVGVQHLFDGRGGSGLRG